MRTSFSAEGEDVLVLKLFERYFPDHGLGGIYVDVGAYHPTRNSNTALLSDLGWHGVNIDARPGSMMAFKQQRPWDRNIECAVGDSDLARTYHSFDRDELNCLGWAAKETAEARGAICLGSVPVTVRKLSELLEGVSAVDFLTIDVEGHEMEVLRTLDWDEHRPAVICVEENTLGPNLLGAWGPPEVAQFLCNGMGYWFHSRLHCSLIFVDATRAVVR